ncbi:MAG: DUF4302 domain-containing protein [Paludibacter sp.]
MIAFLFGSCNRNGADIFPASPAERMNQALKDDFAALTSATNGWSMEYFANSASPGYTLLVKFDVSGKATFAAQSELTKNEAYETDTCLFEMIGDNGPVLTFNTYNNILHRFSNPENPDGYGLQGDYEFVVVSKNSNQLVLKGKKYGAVILMNKISDTISWRQYADDLAEMDSLLFINASNVLKMKIGSTNYTFSDGPSHVFSVRQGLNTALEVPFIVTKTGIRFYASQEIGGLKFQTFELNTDKSALVSIENPDVKLIGVEDLAVFFADNISSIWGFNQAGMSQDMKLIYDRIFQSCITKYDATDIRLAIKYYAVRNSFVLNLSFSSGQTIYDGSLDFTLNTSGKNTLSLAYKGTGDATGMAFYNDIDGFKEISALISSGFSLSANSMINPQKIKFSRRTDSNSWFELIAR